MSYHRQAKLVIIDSGIGGLSAVQQLTRTCLSAELTYIADEAFAPYGTQPEGFLISRLETLIDYAFSIENATYVVIACHTLSLANLNTPSNVFSLAQSTLKQLEHIISPHHIICSQSAKKLYEAEQISNADRIVVDACQDLINELELHPQDAKESFLIHLKPYADRKVILGCSHFSLFKKLLHSIFPCMEVIDPMDTFCEEIRSTIDQNHHQCDQVVRFKATADRSHLDQNLHALNITYKNPIEFIEILDCHKI